MKIVLSGYYGFDNAGDEALLSAITSSIKTLAPEAEFVVFSGSPAKTAALHGVKAVYYMQPWAVIKELATAKLLISGGGSIFQDVTSTRSLFYYISIVALAKLLGTPVMFYAQGVGPINKKISQKLMRLIANRVDFITLRDEESGELLTQIGVTKPPRRITADPVLALQAEPADIARIKQLLSDINSEKAPLIGVSVRKWEALQAYQPQLARVLDDLSASGYKIVFIPLAFPQDIEESEVVASLMHSPAIILRENLSSKEHLALMAELDLLIGIRLHALVFAARAGIPFAGIAYDPKVTAFLAQFALAPLPLDYEKMKTPIIALLNNPEIKNTITQKARELTQESVENAGLALALIKKAQGR